MCISRAHRRIDKEGKKSIKRKKNTRRDSQIIQRIAHKKKKKETYKIRKGEGKINSEIKGKQKAYKKKKTKRKLN